MGTADEFLIFDQMAACQQVVPVWPPLLHRHGESVRKVVFKLAFALFSISSRKKSEQSPGA